MGVHAARRWDIKMHTNFSTKTYENTWETKASMCGLGVDLIPLTQNRDHWKVHVIMVLELRFP
jgi:hypothetical protein